MSPALGRVHKDMARSLLVLTVVQKQPNSIYKRGASKAKGVVKGHATINVVWAAFSLIGASWCADMLKGTSLMIEGPHFRDAVTGQRTCFRRASFFWTYSKSNWEHLGTEVSPLSTSSPKSLLENTQIKRVFEVIHKNGGDCFIWTL